MSDSEKELFGEPEDGASDAESVASAASAASVREPVHHATRLRRYAPSHAPRGAWLSRVPAFLNLEPKPFDAAKYAAVERSEDQLALEANTVRWRYAAAEGASGAQQTVTRVSNARIVEWSDGSRTLQLGGEHFAVRTRAQPEPSFVCTQHDDERLLATRALVDDSMAFLPTSTSSATHVMLARALQRKQASSQIRVGSVNTTEDPDKLQRDLERAEQAKEKARRKLAAQREELVSYTDRAPGGGSSSGGSRMDVDPRDDDEEDGDVEMRGGRLGGDDDDDDDDDESSAQESSAQESSAKEEEEDDDARAARLNEIKRQDAAPASERAAADDAKPVQRRRVLDDEDSE